MLHRIIDPQKVEVGIAHLNLLGFLLDHLFFGSPLCPLNAQIVVLPRIHVHV